MQRTTSLLISLAAAGLLASAPALAADPQADEPGFEGGAMDRSDEPREENQPRDFDRDMDRDAERSEAPARTSQGQGQYVVEEGDTLGKIAQKELGSADEWQVIARANGIDDPTKLRVGQKLEIPEDSASQQGGQESEFDASDSMR